MNLPDCVIVAGASGFVGRNIVEALRGKTSLLIGANSRGTPVPGCDLAIAVQDLANLPALPERTAIVHVAAYRYYASRFAAEQAEILSANQRLTDAIYQFALVRRIREVRAASSAAVYPASWAVQDDSAPLDLNAWPHDGEAAYAWSKRWGEIAAELWRRRAGIHTISLRLTNPYGPFDTLDESEAHVATAFVIRALGNAPEFEIRGDPDAERDFLFAGDIAAAFAESLSLREVDAAVNLAFGTTTKIVDLALTAMKAAGTERPLKTNPPPPAANAGVKIRRATATKLREIMPGLAPFRTLEQGLRATLEWYRDVLL